MNRVVFKSLFFKKNRLNDFGNLSKIVLHKEDIRNTFNPPITIFKEG
jgi:hypothetical protein